VAEHSVTFEIFYDAAWHVAPVLSGSGLKHMRGTKTAGPDTEPASAGPTLDDTARLYAPRSLASALYGKIGQNTKGRLTVDGTVQISGEIASWKPSRPIKGSPSTAVELAGVLRRIGRGKDPVKPALTRAAIASGPVDWWPLDDGKEAASGANVIPGGAALTPVTATPTISWAGVDAAIVPGGMAALPTLNGGSLTAAVRGTSTSSWRFEAVLSFEAGSLSPTDAIRSIMWTTGGGISQWWIEHGETSCIIFGRSTYIAGLPFGGTVVGSSDPNFADGLPHHIALDVNQLDATNMAWTIHLDGVLVNSGTNTSGVSIGHPQVGAPAGVTINPDFDARVLTAAGVGFWSPHPGTPVDFDAVGGYAGELAADRFSRICAEEGITATVVGTAAETVAMGAQGTKTLLALFDEIASTDDASIFETRADVGLTMRTGESKMNQAPDLSVSFLGQIQPPLVPVLGDEGIRNDATASAPNGSSAHAEQTTGPYNTQLPAVDPQGVGRYQTTVNANTALDTQLTDIAGWAVSVGTFDGTWYDQVTVDLDAARGLIAAVDALDIGDCLAITDLPADEALTTFEGIIIGIEGDLPPKRRLVTFYLIPNAPYRVGKMAQTSGDTDAFVGDLDVDGSTTAAAIAAGAASFTVATAAGPLWSTVADDYPLDVLVAGQRISISAVSGSSSPQTFTVRTAGYVFRYAVASGAIVTPYQPIITTP
jgi:hypothetical protein